LKLVGANSPRGFRMTPHRVVIGDDIDGFQANAGDEGNPIALMRRRTSTFPDRKVILVSSPTVEGTSEIDDEYQQSDQRIWEVPCPECGEFQALAWAQLKWPSPDNTGTLYSAHHNPDHARYICRSCEYPMEHRQKRAMNIKGKWRARERFTGTAGFWHNALASAFETWPEIVAQFLKEHRDPKQFRVFVNTKFAEVWKVKLGEQLDYQKVYQRRETYTVPDNVVVLTCAVDVQASPARLEVEVKGWGVGEESWGIEHRVFHGSIDQPGFAPGERDQDGVVNAWRALDQYLTTKWEHPAGVQLGIHCTFIDSSHRTNEVYTFVRSRQHRNIFAIKGSSETGSPIVNNPNTTKDGVMLIIIGVHTAKSTIYDRLQKQDPGPGFLHFHMGYTEEFCKQLMAEKLTQKWRMGKITLAWELPDGVRNEALDLNVYNYAALEWTTQKQGANLDTLRAQLTASPAGPPTPVERPNWATGKRKENWIRRRR